MTKKMAAGVSILIALLALGVVSASPRQQASPSLTVERSEDRLSASAVWSPNQGAEYQAFFVVAELIQGEEDETGYGIVADSFRYVDYPLAGGVGSLVIDELDATREYIYGVAGVSRDSGGRWVWSQWVIFRDSDTATSAETDRDALVDLYNATDGVNWRQNTNWLSNAPIGEWYGVETDADGRVVVLSLWLNKLEGDLPAELGNLAKLERLNLLLNKVNGSIPSEMGMLGNLKELILMGNNLTGVIPVELGNLVNLEKLFLSSGNQFTGCIPRGLRDVAVNDFSELGLEFCS